MDEMLLELGLTSYVGEEGRNGAYVIDLGNDKEFGKLYTTLDNSENIVQEEESVLLTVHNASIIYNYKNEYQLVLKADFDHELYSVIITEIK